MNQRYLFLLIKSWLLKKKLSKKYIKSHPFGCGFLLCLKGGEYMAEVLEVIYSHPWLTTLWLLILVLPLVALAERK